ncbi:extensin-like, partial [Homalodisca vitripennis]|uniref:extensin-like n=1 Tax=Homalodisca vitripennis TaxID=197043 RepID=UPI001EEAD2A9
GPPKHLREITQPGRLENTPSRETTQTLPVQPTTQTPTTSQTPTRRKGTTSPTPPRQIKKLTRYKNLPPPLPSPSSPPLAPTTPITFPPPTTHPPRSTRTLPYPQLPTHT